jgi:hypothetical protein
MCRAANINLKLVVQAGHFDEKWALQKDSESQRGRFQLRPRPAFSAT